VIPVGRNARRERIAAAFEAFCAAVGATLGAAARTRDGVVDEHALAMVEKWLREDGLDAARADPALARVLANTRVAAAVAAVEADRGEVFDEWLRTAPDELEEILREAAPGPAGAVGTDWLAQPGTDDGSVRVPELWRIGTARVGSADAGGEFGVGVPLLDHAHLQVSTTPETRGRGEALVEALLMRVLGYFRPGLVHVHVWDVGQFTGSLPALYPLTRTGLLTVHDPALLAALLGELSDRIRRVHTRVLVDGHQSLQVLAAASGIRTEPWVVTVLLGNRQALREEEHRQLQRIARSGPACGVHLVLVDLPMTMNAQVETVRLTPQRATCSMTGPYAALTPDPPLPRGQVSAACHRLVAEHVQWQARLGSFEDLLPRERHWGGSSSRAGLTAPVGFADGLPVEVRLDDASPHALIGGPSGSGKTNLILAMISSLAARYPPEELELYLLDFKEGVSFAQFAPGTRDPSWLPQARLVGVNINTDREFGLALLQFLAEEMRRRAETAKVMEVTKLEELRRAVSEHAERGEALPEGVRGPWPRIVAVIDEFQYLFAERDAVTRSAVALLEDVARRGRSQGIHLVLASQDVSGIEAFWGRRAIFEQFVLRLALPRARRVLADLNDATLDLPRWHAVVNHESGIRHGNEIARIPDATAKGSVDRVQQVLHAAYAQGRLPERFAPEVRDRRPSPDRPRLFDGSRAPRVSALLATLPRAPSAAPRVLVGQCIDVLGSAASLSLPDVPGRNLAVLGAGASDACRVLGAAAASLAAQLGAGTAEILLAPLVPEAGAPAGELADVLHAAGHDPERVELGGFRARVETLAAGLAARATAPAGRRPSFLVVYGADAAEPLLERAGVEALRQVLRFGPENGVHVLGWWRSVARLRSLLTLGASVDDIGCLVALDVQGAELGALLPGMLVAWAPRPGRGLFFDRTQHAAPEVVLVPAPDGMATGGPLRSSWEGSGPTEESE